MKNTLQQALERLQASPLKVERKHIEAGAAAGGGGSLCPIAHAIRDTISDDFFIVVGWSEIMIAVRRDHPKASGARKFLTSCAVKRWIDDFDCGDMRTLNAHMPEIALKFGADNVGVCDEN